MLSNTVVTEIESWLINGDIFKSNSISRWFSFLFSKKKHQQLITDLNNLNL